MKHIVQFRKAANRRLLILLSILLITILTLTIPTKSYGQRYIYFDIGETWYIGMEKLTLTADELRAAAVANGGTMNGDIVTGGYAVVSLRYYAALPPGSLDRLADSGAPNIALHIGSTYAVQFVDPADTIGIVFAGNATVQDSRQHNIIQPASLNVYANNSSKSFLVYQKS